MASDVPEEFRYPVSEAIRAHALTFPEAAEGASCVNRAFSAGGKNFTFLGEKDDVCVVRLKLEASMTEVSGLAASEPERYQVGSGGWTKLTFSPESHPPLDDLRRWMTESFHLLAPKRLSSPS